MARIMSSCKDDPPKEKGHTADAICVSPVLVSAASGGVGSKGHRSPEFFRN